MDTLYGNIGGKLKGLAKAMFIVETLAAIIGGIALIAIDEDLMLYGLLVLLVGPFVAYLGSWFLYAFGELVEKMCRNESNTKSILKFLKENQKKEEKPAEPQAAAPQNAYAPKIEAAIGYEEANAYVPSGKNTIVCPQCNIEQPISRKICWNCGTKFAEVDE